METLPEILSVRMRSVDLVHVLSDDPAYVNWATNYGVQEPPKGTKTLCAIFDIKQHVLRQAIFAHLNANAQQSATA